MIDKTSYKLLRRFYRRQNLTFDEIQKITHFEEKEHASRYISFLLASRFIQKWNSDEIINNTNDTKRLGYSISLSGIAYVEQRRQDRLHFWIPYLITTFIAAMSLVASLAEHWGTIISWFSF